MGQLSHSQKFLLILFLTMVFLYSFNQIKESDPFYHLKAGEVIWQTKSVPRADIFSYTASGAEWIAHEWLAEVIFYFVYKFFNFWGLIVFAALIAAFVYYLIFRLAVKKGANFYLAIFSIFFLSYLTFRFWIPRPQIFAYLAFVVLIYLLENYRQSPKTKYLWFIVLDIWFWANVNASVILGLVILIFYLFAEAVKFYLPKLSQFILSQKAIAYFGLTTLVAFGFSLLNPNTYKVLFYSVYIKESVQLFRVLEWQSIISFRQDPKITVFLVLMLFVDAFLIWWLGLRKTSRDLTYLGLVMGVSIMPFISIRHYAFWPLAAVLPFAVLTSEILKKALQKFSTKELLFIFSSIGLVFLGGRYFSFPRYYLNENIMPAQAADFIENNQLKGPFFNLYNEGSYLIWRFWPREKVFIDGRSEIYGKKQIREFFTIIGGLADWEKLVDEKYRINYFILPYLPAETLGKSIQPLIVKLFKENWSLIYWDDTALIFVRTSPENQTLIEKYIIRHNHPYRDPRIIPENEAELAAKEIEALLERFPQSSVIQKYAQMFLDSH